MRVFVEVFPREITDVVCESLDNISDRGGAIDDATRDQTINDAIVNAQRVGLALGGTVSDRAEIT